MIIYVIIVLKKIRDTDQNTQVIILFSLLCIFIIIIEISIDTKKIRNRHQLLKKIRDRDQISLTVQHTQCNTLQHTATHCNTVVIIYSRSPPPVDRIQSHHHRVLQCAAVSRSVLQSVAVCCSVLQCVTVYCSMLQFAAANCSVHTNSQPLNPADVLQCVAMRCGVLQCVAMGSCIGQQIVCCCTKEIS